MIQNWDLSGVHLHMFDADTEDSVEDILREVLHWIHGRKLQRNIDSIRVWQATNEWEQYRWLAEVEYC